MKPRRKRGGWSGRRAALLALALVAPVGLAACAGGSGTTAHSTPAGLEADMMASRPASQVGLAPPIVLTPAVPTPSGSVATTQP